MKTAFKKIILLVLLYGVTMHIINAQDSSNDATWEETIEFINNNISYIKEVDLVGFGFDLKRNRDNCKIEIDDKYLRATDGNGTGEYIKVNLLKLRHVFTYYGEVTLKTTGKDVKYKKIIRDGTLGGPYIANTAELKIYDIEMKKRFFKAFEHLEYLATKKREDDIKASGSKF